MVFKLNSDIILNIRQSTNHFGNAIQKNYQLYENQQNYGL